MDNDSNATAFTVTAWDIDSVPEKQLILLRIHCETAEGREIHQHNFYSLDRERTTALIADLIRACPDPESRDGSSPGPLVS